MTPRKSQNQTSAQTSTTELTRRAVALRHGPRSPGCPQGPFRGLQGQKLFMIMFKILFVFPTVCSHKCMVEFSRGYIPWAIATDNAEADTRTQLSSVKPDMKEI